MSVDGQTGQGFKRKDNLYRYGGLDWISEFSNIAVATKLFPNTGLPLPFVSYGVSSLLSMFVGIGLVLNVGLQRKNTHN